MNIGFTGTRFKIDTSRLAYIHHILNVFRITTTHDGMCVGGDEQFNELIKKFYPDIKTVGHPPINRSKMNSRTTYDVILPAKDYLIRNHDIVDSVHGMVAIPQTKNEELRSGTWATIRYAKKAIKGNKGKCKKLWIINPNLSVDFFDYSILTFKEIGVL